MDYKEIFQRFSRLNILIIGDVMVDSYMWGKVERISPEAPVPVCTIAKKESRLGGAANVALNVAAMGAEPILCSIVGEDASGELLLSLMQESGLSIKGIVTSQTRQTTTKTRVLSGYSQMLRVDEETDKDILKEEEAILLKAIFDIIATKRIDAIIFQDYDKGVITKNIIESVVAKAKSNKIPTAADPKKRNFLNYDNITLFKPNLKELKEGLKTEIDTINEETLRKATDLLHDRHKIEKVFVTLSDKGVFMVDYGKQTVKSCFLSAHLRQISDVSGAGDTVISVASLCLALGMEAVDIAMISNLAGGLVCESVGVVPIDREILFNELTKQI
ncbi:MAG: PfkB family carbohydrate kinase [Bacteroidales bacterium]|jgi:rfaE bifunctional protein kinase chain/domain|nr:PfkB family carbohydrate kinase [Bacteroidales bacterium]